MKTATSIKILLILLFICVCLMSITPIDESLNNAQNQISHSQDKISNEHDDMQSYIDDIQNQISDVKFDLQSIYDKLERYKNELSYTDYSDDIADIYDKISDLYKIIESYYEQLSDDEEFTKSNEEFSKEESERSDEESEADYDDYNDNIYDDMFDIYYGRLHISDLNISVALYYGNDTNITDRTDSANIFSRVTPSNFIIADHNNQEFSKLFGVKVGTKGYIKLKNGEILNIKCVSVFNGHNTEKELTDESYNSVMGMADYTMYTCRDNWKNVLICFWDKE